MGTETFSIEICGTPLDLPTEEQKEWSIRDILGLAPERGGYERRCPGASCTILIPEGAMITVPSDDPLDITLVPPEEAERRRGTGGT